jgi:2-keto-4-pentenoate hydratase/2-oxohepta-3-ene-1,7-dioic acid hydratase in catechol pathway
MPEKPIIFTKPFTSIVGSGAPVAIAAAVADQVDWEAEIAVVIGTGGADISRSEALDHVFGYCLANDLSARTLQLANAPMAQWFKGKSLDGFCPLGPWIVPRADIADEGAIDVELTVNGVTKQEFVSGNMYFDVPAIIEYLSLGMALLPGDVILTGTSSGVGYWRDPKEFLHPGDEVVIRSSVLGVLTTPMVGASA